MMETEALSNTRLNKLAAKAAAKAIKSEKERVENDIPEDLTQDDISLTFSSLEGTPKYVSDGPGYDIFDHCQKILDEQHVQSVYTISKNGELLCTRHHPYSWERLQKEFGGGHYQIVAKTVNGKKYIKTDTRTVAEVQASLKNEEEQKSSGMEFDKLILLMQQQREQDRREMREALERQKEEEERRRLEEKERARETISQNQNQTMLLIEMMKINAEKSERATLEIAKIQQQAEERAARAAEKNSQLMMQMMQNQMQMQIETMKSKKDDGFTPLELMQMMKNAEENGYKKMAELLQLARAEADERLALRGDNDGEKAEKKTITDTLIESMLPTITSALAGQATQALSQPTQSAPQRRSLHPTRQESVRQGAPKPISKQTVPVRATKPVGQTSDTKNSLGFPTITFDETKTAAVSSISENLPTVTELEELLGPVITDSLINQIPASQAALKVAEVIKKHGLSKENFCAIMTEEQLLGLVNKYGLPELAFDWFKELHAHISTTA